MSLIILALTSLLVRAGLAMYVAGLSRAKNSAGAIARVLADFGVATLAAFAVGGVFVTLGVDQGWGRPPSWVDAFSHLHVRQVHPFVLVIVLLSTIGTGVVVGALVERSRFPAGLACSAALGAVVVPTLFAWDRGGGWLVRKLDFVDDAGASWLHAACGAAAVVLARAVGPRLSKYHRDGSASVIPGHNVPLAGIGAVVMTTGLVGLAGSFGDAAILPAVLAVAAGIVASLAFGQVKYGKPDVLIVVTGALGAAVAIAGGAGVVAPVSAVVIGAVAGVLVPMAAVNLDLRLRVDDPTNAVAIHLVGGAWGTMAAGVFCPGRNFWDWAAGTLVQALGLGIAVALGAAAGLGVAVAMKGKLRSKEADEFDGLDLAEHDIGGYPDFQQNSIKSYHLREA